MNRTIFLFLLVISPALAILLAILGALTLTSNPLGWFLLLTGIAYFVGLMVVYPIRGRRIWESDLPGPKTQEERDNRSFWFISFGMAAVFFLPVTEYLIFPATLPRTAWMANTGIGLIILGAMLFAWARRTLRKSYAGQLSVKVGQPLVQSGPYRFIRHPAYAGYLWMALGLCLGYSSLVGLILILVVMLPALRYRIQVEERLLTAHFGDAYRQYQWKTKRLIPGIW